MKFKLFSLQRVLSKNDPYNIDLIMEKLKKSQNGDSFLINFTALYYKWKKFDKAEVVHYLTLAALRDPEVYRMTGDISLPIESIYTGIDAIEENRMLSISDRKVLFLFEEDEKRRRNP